MTNAAESIPVAFALISACALMLTYAATVRSQTAREARNRERTQ